MVRRPLREQLSYGIAALFSIMFFGFLVTYPVRRKHLVKAFLYTLIIVGNFFSLGAISVYLSKVAGHDQVKLGPRDPSLDPNGFDFSYGFWLMIPASIVPHFAMTFLQDPKADDKAKNT